MIPIKPKTLMEEPILRTTGEISLLEEKSGRSLRILTPLLTPYVMSNSIYAKRCLSKIDAGREDLNKRLIEVRRVIFNNEELVYWFHKIKEDAVSETILVFTKFEATLGMAEDKIDFERVGFLSGIHAAADHYLDLMIAIEPLDKDKAHYSVLDRLESLDELFIKTAVIPGYYAIQKDNKIVKQHFELKNLDDYWSDFISLKDRHDVPQGFGDIRHLMNQYHFEFRWEMIKIKPFGDVKYFLDFHLNSFSKEPIDFINHVEFRIMPEMHGVAGSNYPIYKNIIKEWLREKRVALNSEGEKYLLESIVSVSASFLDNVFVYRDFQDENKYNTILCSFLNQRFTFKRWAVKDQSLGGSSDSESKANRAGMSFRDIIIIDEKNHHISAIECFRLRYVPTQHESDSEISQHLKKIFRNEPIGLSPLFIVVYCETKSYASTWDKYVNYVSNIDFSNYKLIDFSDNLVLGTKRANINIAKATHIRETSEISVYHIFINLYP
jgi:hypothetical protein